MTGRDAVRALDDARRGIRALEDHRSVSLSALGSRYGRLFVGWQTLKGVLRAQPGNDALLSVIASPDVARGDEPADGAWDPEARDAAERHVGDLLREIATLRRELDAVSSAWKGVAAEKAAERLATAKLRAALRRLENDVERSKAFGEAVALALEADNASLRARLEESGAVAREHAAEREAWNAVEADLNRRIAREGASADALRAALGRLRDVVVRERRSAREALSLSTRLAGERLLPTGGSIPTRLSPAVEQKRASLIGRLKAAATFLDVARPDVSVIIPAYNAVEMTLDCLDAIVQSVDDGATMQIVVVDDASPKESIATALEGLPFVTAVRNGANLGFLRSCNVASSLATGRYVHFLNNDTLVRRGWLQELVVCADSDERIGAVGSKLLFADGVLQEAGGIIWRDASGWNYGRGDDPDDPRYNYVRDVDYCSGASLLVRRDVFESLGRFDDAFAPAYFEDCDLCFAIRDLGLRVVFQPKSEVVHLEGMSSGTSLDSGTKRFQAVNAPKFAKKWQGALQRHYVPDSVPGIQAARRLQAPRTLVMVESYVPEYDKDAGSKRLLEIIELCRDLGYSVVYLPDNMHRSEPYTTVFQDLGVEIVYATGNGKTIADELRERLAIADVGWIGRPDLATRYLSIFREFPDLPVVYDTVDLHFVRIRRELELKGITAPDAWAEWERERDRELDAVRSADVALTVTEVERRVLLEQGAENVAVVPTIHRSFPRITPFADTRGVLFIGGYQHPPNIDAATWLCEQIMPLVWRKLPQVQLTLLGSNAPESVLALASHRVRVPGYVAEVEPYFETARVFVAPLRFGAGMKGKIGQAFSHGVPTITTPVGAEGFDLVDGVDALIAGDAESFAAAIVRAYEDRSLWQTLSENAAQVVKRFSPEAVRDRLSDVLRVARRSGVPVEG